MGQYMLIGTAGAHEIDVTGVDVNKGRVYTNNPWDIRGNQSYNEFRQGVAGGIPAGTPFGFCSAANS